MSTHDDTTQPSSLLRRRIAVAMIVVGVGAMLPAFTSADENFTCPVGTENDGLVTNYPDPVDVVVVDNWPAVYVGVGLTNGTHFLYGNGVDFMNNAVLPVLADTGFRATDAHLCKLSETPVTTTTVVDTTTTVADTTTTTVADTTTTTVADTTTTTVVDTTTTLPNDTTTTTVVDTTTTLPNDTTTTTIDEESGTTTTTIDEESGTTTTTIDEESGTTTTTLVDQESGTTTTTVDDSSLPTTTTTLVDQESATTTTIVTELPRTGSGVSNLTAFGGLLILLGGLMLHSTRRIEALD